MKGVKSIKVREGIRTLIVRSNYSLRYISLIDNEIKIDAQIYKIKIKEYERMKKKTVYLSNLKKRKN